MDDFPGFRRILFWALLPFLLLLRTFGELLAVLLFIYGVGALIVAFIQG